MIKSLLTATCAFLICTCVSLAAADDPLTAWSFDDPADLGAATGRVPVAGIPGTGTAADPAGKIGGALSLDGSSGAIIDLGDHTELQLTTYSISGWFKTTDMSDYRVITSRNVNWTNRTWWVTIWKQDGGQGHPDGALVWRTSSSGAKVDLASQASVADGQWHHFAVVIDGNTKAELWLDGILQDSLANPGTPHMPAVSALIGAEKAGYRHFNGQVDELQVHNRPLAKSEIEVAAENVLYREVFTMDGEDDLGNPVTFRRPIESFGWHGIQKYHFDYPMPAEHGERCTNSGLASVNSQPYAGTDAIDGGIYTSNPEYPVLLFTEEYQDLDISQLHTIRFAQSSGQGSKLHLALQVGEQWYVTDEPWVNPDDGQLDAKSFSTVECVIAQQQWALLAVEGTYGEDGGNLAKTSTQVSRLPLNGQVKAFGIYTGRNEVSNKRAFDDFTIIGTNDPVLPAYEFAVDIPTASKVSPVCIEGTNLSGATPMATVDGLPAGLNVLSDHGFYLDVSLSTDSATTVSIDSESGDITWSPTVFDGSEIVIRADDSLLLQGEPNGSISIGVGSGTGTETMSLDANGKIPAKFTKPGNYDLISYDADGYHVGSLQVTAVTVQFPLDVAVALYAQRDLKARVYPASARDEISFTENDPALCDVANSTLNEDNENEVDMTVMVDGLGVSYAVARIGNGAIVSISEIEEYVIETGALSNLVVNGEEQFGSTDIIIRPYVANLNVRCEMFAHTATFAGGDTELSLNTTGDFFQVIDEETSQVIGQAIIDIEFPPGETDFCFNIFTSQSMVFPKPPAEGTGTVILNHGCINISRALKAEELFLSKVMISDVIDEPGPVPSGDLGNINGNEITVNIFPCYAPKGGEKTLNITSWPNGANSQAEGIFHAFIVEEDNAPVFTNNTNKSTGYIEYQSGSPVTANISENVKAHSAELTLGAKFDVKIEKTIFLDRIIIWDVVGVTRSEEFLLMGSGGNVEFDAVVAPEEALLYIGNDEIKWTAVETPGGPSVIPDDKTGKEDVLFYKQAIEDDLGKVDIQARCPGVSFPVKAVATIWSVSAEIDRDQVVMDKDSEVELKATILPANVDIPDDQIKWIMPGSDPSVVTGTSAIYKPTGLVGENTVQLMIGREDTYNKINEADTCVVKVVDLSIDPTETHATKGKNTTIKSVIKPDGAAIPEADIAWTLNGMVPAAGIGESMRCKSDTAGTYDIQVDIADSIGPVSTLGKVVVHEYEIIVTPLKPAANGSGIASRNKLGLCEEAIIYVERVDDGQSPPVNWKIVRNGVVIKTEDNSIQLEYEAGLSRCVDVIIAEIPAQDGYAEDSPQTDLIVVSPENGGFLYTRHMVYTASGSGRYQDNQTPKNHYPGILMDIHGVTQLTPNDVNFTNLEAREGEYEVTEPDEPGLFSGKGIVHAAGTWTEIVIQKNKHVIFKITIPPGLIFRLQNGGRELSLKRIIPQAYFGRSHGSLEKRMMIAW